MEGRKRTVQVKFYVTEEERRLIREKMKLIPTRNMAAYLRKMAIDGYVVHIDTTDIRAQTAELQKIGVNVNQIARRLNSMCHGQKEEGLQEENRPQTVARRSGGQPDHAACPGRCRHGIHYRQGHGAARPREHQPSSL